MGCCYGKDKNEIKTELNTTLINTNIQKDNKNIINNKINQKEVKTTKKLVSLDLLQTAANSGIIKYQIINEINSFQNGFGVLIDGTLHIYTQDINGVVYPKGKILL